MFAFAYDIPRLQNWPPSPLMEELETIREMRQRVMDGRELDHCTPLVRYLIEREIPLLMNAAARRGWHRLRRRDQALWRPNTPRGIL